MQTAMRDDPCILDACDVGPALLTFFDVDGHFHMVEMSDQQLRALASWSNSVVQSADAHV